MTATNRQRERTCALFLFLCHRSDVKSGLSDTQLQALLLVARRVGLFLFSAKQ